MNRQRMSALILSLLVLILVTALAGAEPAVDPLEVTNVDGTWSNPAPSGIELSDCYNLENTPGDTTDENKIYAGVVANDTDSCYTDPPYNASPFNGGAGFDEGSGFGFDGKNGTLSVQPSTPFLLGLITHYNRRIGSNSGLSGAQLDIATTITDATPAAPVFQYNIELNETPNPPANNSGSFCPYPDGSFYGSAYLAFNGGFPNDDDTVTFGNPFTHPNVGGDPPADQRGDQWLCGDGVTAALVGGVSQTFEVGGEEYTLVLLGVSYPSVTALNSTNAVSDLEACGTYPGAENTNIVFETRELQATPGCIWAQFTAPSAVGLSSPPVAASASPATGAVLAVAMLAVLMAVALLLWRRATV